MQRYAPILACQVKDNKKYACNTSFCRMSRMLLVRRKTVWFFNIIDTNHTATHQHKEHKRQKQQKHWYERFGNIFPKMTLAYNVFKGQNNIPQSI